MQLKRIATERRDSVQDVLLSGDPLDSREARELSHVFEELREDTAVRVVVVSSTGDDFCSGPANDLDPLDSGHDPPSRLASLRQPVVLAIRGRCADVGLECALAGDIRIASPNASFASSAVSDGRLPCWGGTQRLTRTVGRSFALRLLLLGESVPAPVAHARGLVHEIAVDPLRRAMEIAEQLASLSPLALSFAKEAIHLGSEMPIRHALRFEGDLNHLLQASADRAEGLAAFREKRHPRIAGR